MNDFSGIKKVCVLKSLVDETQSFLRAVGKAGSEGMALWVGSVRGDEFEVSNLLIPKQRGIHTGDGVCVVVDGDELHRINVELFETKLQLIAQIHSHPTGAFHSDTDDEFAIATTIGSLSLVIPDFASRDFRLADCAVYRLNRTGAWQHLSPGRVSRLIHIRDM